MQCILENTDIFDDEIDQKLKVAICDNKKAFIKEASYMFKVSFHVNLLDDERFEKFYVPNPSKASKGAQEDKIRDVMKYQLKRMEQVLIENEIETYSTTIQGEYLDSENIIKIEMLEDNYKPEFTRRGKVIPRFKICTVVPSLSFTQETMNELASKRINKIFLSLMKAIKYKKIMSDILGIDETVDDKKLFKAFVQQYGELWLATEEREKELVQKLKDQATSVMNKYIEQMKDENNIEE